MTNPRWAVTIGLITAVLLSGCALRPGSSGALTTGAEAARMALGQDSRFAGIAPKDEGLIGQASWYEVTPVDVGWKVVIRIGWGDCEAGCISEHRWTYTVGRDANVELNSEVGDPLPGVSGVQGKATAGPTCPVERNPPDPQCAERPVAGAVLVFTNAAGTRSIPDPRTALPDIGEGEAPVTDPAVRRATLAETAELLGAGPLVRGSEPVTGVRPAEDRPVARTDCGWIV